MPSKSKAQQRFMGMVHAYKKGELKGSEVSKDVKDAAKGMKKKDTKKYASTKHKGLPNKVKKEELKRLIAKYGAKRVRETVMAVRPKAVTVSGNRMPEDPDFEYDPEKVTDEGFGGELKGKDKDKFEKARIENAEQLGYKATGTSDTKKQKLKMAHELKEVSNPTSGIMMAHKKKKKHKHNEGSFKTTLRPQKKDINKMKVRFKSDPRRVYTLKRVETGRVGGTSYMFAAPGNRKEHFTPKTWDLANKKGWLSLESVNERKNPKREKTKKSFLKNLQKTEKTIRRIKQFAKSNQWGPISNFVEDDLVYDMTALKNDIDTIISLPIDESVDEIFPKGAGKKISKAMQKKYTLYTTDKRGKKVKKIKTYGSKQAAAVAMGKLMKNLDTNYFPNLLLHGPPGTGKTTTSVAILAMNTLCVNSTCAAAPTNMAVFSQSSGPCFTGDSEVILANDTIKLVSEIGKVYIALIISFLILIYP